MDIGSLEFLGKITFEQTEVICPEGLWVKQAGIQLLQKQDPEGWGKLSEIDAARNLVYLLLVTPELEAFSVSSSSGAKETLDRGYLRSSQSVSDFVKGYKPYSADRRQTSGKYHFVNKSQFENFLADKPIIDPPETQQTGDMPPSYIPPYMQFMFKAARALNLSNKKRTGKNIIVDWLRDNWPDDLDGKSERMIESMATMLRSPEHKKGGNVSWKK